MVVRMHLLAMALEPDSDADCLIRRKSLLERWFTKQAINRAVYRFAVRKAAPRCHSRTGMTIPHWAWRQSPLSERYINMCDAIAISIRDLPLRYQHHPAIQARLTGRGGDEEIQFFYDRKPFPPLLPILLEDQFRIVRWGNRDKRSKHLPHSGRVEHHELLQGCWQHANITEVVIVGNVLLHRGVWFPLLEGIKGIFLAMSMTCQPSSCLWTSPATTIRS